MVLLVGGLLVAAPATPSGFQVMTQGARATGMGLAFTGVADDPSAIFFNPAGMGFQEHFSIMLGGSVLGRAKADFTGADPFPGEGITESVQKQEFVIPTLYVVVPLTTELSFGLGVNAPYGLGLRWNDPENFSGRFISQNAVIKSLDVNPVFSYKLFPELSIAAGADLRFSKVQLERNSNLGIVDPFTGAVRRPRARQAQQQPDEQQRLGLERRHSLEADDQHRCRRRVPQQDQGRLRRHGGLHAAIHAATRSSTAWSPRSSRRASTR